jgi:hypothetical protein
LSCDCSVSGDGRSLSNLKLIEKQSELMLYLEPRLAGIHAPVVLGHREASRKGGDTRTNSMQNGFWKRDVEVVKESKETRTSFYP